MRHDKPRTSRSDPVAAPHPRLAAPQRPAEALTRREREILALLAEGLTDRGIGERLWLTRKTVETHIRHILAKLNIPDGPHHNRRVLAAVVYLHAEPDPDAAKTSRRGAAIKGGAPPPIPTRLVLLLGRSAHDLPA